MTISRRPIHLGSGEPILLLHPFLMSQTCGKRSRQQLAETGRYEVFAPTMPGHNGGPKGRFLVPELAGAGRRRRAPDGRAGLGHRPHRRQLARRLGGVRTGAARTRAHASPASRRRAAGRHWTPVKFEIDRQVPRGHAGAGWSRWLFGQRVLQLPFTRHLAHLPVSATPDGVSDDAACATSSTTWRTARPTSSCWSSRCCMPGLLELAERRCPPTWCICEKDRVLPASAVHPPLHQASCRRTRRSPSSTASGTSRCSRRPTQGRRPDRRLRRPLRRRPPRKAIG